MKENNMTLAWKLYEDGRSYNNRLVLKRIPSSSPETSGFISRTLRLCGGSRSPRSIF